MEYYFPKALKQLIAEFSRLPSIGEKSALRLAYHIINKDPQNALNLAKSLIRAVEEVKFCEQCFFLTESKMEEVGLCVFCKDQKRTPNLICVVEKPMDVMAIERTGEFRGHYHVLHGVWAPMRGTGPEDIKLAELIKRIKNSEVTELILATSSTVEGDATALYIQDALESLNRTSGEEVKCTRLAQGVPKGGDLEYLDDLTLAKALSGRLQM